MENIIENLTKIKRLGFKVCFENYAFEFNKPLKLVDYYFLINSDLSINKKVNKQFFSSLKIACTKHNINMLYIPTK